MEDKFQLRIKGLKKSFAGEIVLDGISLDVKKGEAVVILGPSGCGKSTLLRCLNGLEKTDSGTIMLDGVQVSDDVKSLSQLRQRLGMVFQSYDLFPHKNVLENIILAPMKVQKCSREEATHRAEQLLRRVGLWEKRFSRPSELSGGQKQRVAIVRALCMKPEIMLFDEVTAALDPEMVREVSEVMLELSEGGMTMLIVTHEMQFARAIADRIVFLDGGKICEEAPPEEFFTAPKTERARNFLKTFTFEKHKRNQKEGDFNENI